MLQYTARLCVKTLTALCFDGIRCRGYIRCGGLYYGPSQRPLAQASMKVRTVMRALAANVAAMRTVWMRMSASAM